MTPEEKSLLERTYKIAQENNGMLRSIRRTNRFSAVLRVVYWVIIIGLSIGAFYFVQPYVNALVGAYGQITGTASSTESTFNSLKNLFK